MASIPIIQQGEELCHLCVCVVWVCGLRVLVRETAAPFSFSVQTTTLSKRACFPSDHTTNLVHAHSTAATEQSHCCRGGDKAGGRWLGIKRQAAKGQGRDHRRKKAGEGNLERFWRSPTQFGRVIGTEAPYTAKDVHASASTRQGIARARGLLAASALQSAEKKQGSKEEKVS